MEATANIAAKLGVPEFVLCDDVEYARQDGDVGRIHCAVTRRVRGWRKSVVLLNILKLYGVRDKKGRENKKKN